MSRFRRLLLPLILLGLGAAPLGMLLLLVLPQDILAGIDPTGQVERVIRGVQNRQALALTLAAAFATVAVLAFVLSRRPPLLKAYAVVLVLAGMSYGGYEFQRRFPYQGVLDLERFGDAATILLGTDTRLGRFEPRSELRVEREAVVRARYPAIDVHFHFASLPPDMTPESLVRAMDAAGIAKLIDLDGGPGTLDAHARKFLDPYPDRFILFARPNFGAIQREDGIARQADWLMHAAYIGARGVKVNKSLGLGVRDVDGTLLALDDPRLDPIWDTAGRLGMPVILHTADPPAFFEPVDPTNERYEELSRFPEWSFSRPGYPSFEDLMAQRERLLARHPGTNFIGAHMGSNEDDLARAGRLLDRYPNYYVDLSSRIAALGRQPFTTRAFFLKYQDRILFGTDGGYALDTDGSTETWTPERYFRSYIEFLETANEYIEYPLWGINKQGKWHVYGIDLPDDVLEKIYHGNVERLLPSDALIAEQLDAYLEPLKTGRPIFPTPGTAD